MAETVLLTGASGFVGRAVQAALLARGYRVEAVGRGERLGWHKADLLRPEDRDRLLSSTRATTLVHLAWFVEHGTFWHSPLNEDWRQASIQLAQAFLARGGTRILAFGSCAEYAATGPAGPWPETRPLAPATPYGRAKAALSADLASLCQTHGAGFLWLRLFHLYGPHEAPARFVPSILAALREGRIARVRSAHLLRDFASTAHIGALVADLLSTAAAGAMNLGSGAPRSLGALAHIMAEAAGRTDLLALGQDASTDPPAMVPDLTRLWQAVGHKVELPERALRHAFTYSRK